MKSVQEEVAEYREKQKEPWGGARWAKPVIPVAVENDFNAAAYDGENWRSGINATFDEETIERFRIGQVCLICWNPHEQNFPDQCAVCGYAMRERQRDDWQREFEGEKWIGPTTSLQDEQERMIHEGRRKRHVPGSQILLPGKDF